MEWIGELTPIRLPFKNASKEIYQTCKNIWKIETSAIDWLTTLVRAHLSVSVRHRSPGYRPTALTSAAFAGQRWLDGILDMFWVVHSPMHLSFALGIMPYILLHYNTLLTIAVPYFQKFQKMVNRDPKDESTHSLSYSAILLF